MTTQFPQVLFVFLFMVSASSRLWSAGDIIIEGYTEVPSFYQGDRINFYLSANRAVPDCPLPIYDIQRRIIGQVNADVRPQVPTTAEPWKDGFGFDLTTRYTVPSSMHSGIYWLDTVPFYVKDVSKQSDIVVVFPTNTVNAYTESGGESLYSTPRAETVSLQRPQRWHSTTFPFNRWLDKQDYSYRYVADTDLEHFDEISGSKLMILTGGPEYWTREARQNFDRFIDEGGNVLIIAGNTMHRPVTYDDPDHPTQMTEVISIPGAKGMWLEAYLDYPPSASTGGDFWYGGYGYGAPGGDKDLGWDGFKIVDENATYLAGTGLRNDDIIPLVTREYDAPPITGFDPITGVPQIDKNKLGFYDIHLIAYDRAWSNWRKQDGYGGWWEFQKTPESGRAIVVGSTDWTWSTTENLFQTIDRQMIDYLLNWTPVDLADFDDDGQISLQDLEILSAAIRNGNSEKRFDTSKDGLVDAQDRDFLISTLMKLTYGDVNEDGIFNSRDLVQLFKIGEYDDALAANSTWGTGDFNGDGEFNSSDFVTVLNRSQFVRESQRVQVPEPATCGLLESVSLCLVARRGKALRKNR